MQSSDSLGRTPEALVQKGSDQFRNGSANGRGFTNPCRSILPARDARRETGRSPDIELNQHAIKNICPTLPEWFCIKRGQFARARAEMVIVSLCSQIDPPRPAAPHETMMLFLVSTGRSGGLQNAPNV
ncbi:uncharacterized protein BP01DRAFT_122064 [Aspergillus saccharolyticus JOP 1030-1]|uniref:Uncharacterized protein n=1 Tax=Aspergillus saccharolyticus JOP 1030-1 TaxID=1450539 RepID=A0A319A6F5_9EURO|nr:hypothetical protein BP01DRAFT_122064 [Aspergillus saccharolyticus JOP 1030-1]PYH42972.1 hypothetical protein BP01DRAFT_122064 [Aspergillus saccharolyticus JOP 1030-1]